MTVPPSLAVLDDVAMVVGYAVFLCAVVAVWTLVQVNLETLFRGICARRKARDGAPK